MPYNTRRKSLSLPSLGIHIPITNAERAANAAAAAAAAATSAAVNNNNNNTTRAAQSPRHSRSASLHSTNTSMAPPSPPRSSRITPPMSDAERMPSPKKKSKRSLSGDHAHNSGAVAKRLQTEAARHALDIDTPPPSPRSSCAYSVDMADATDDAFSGARDIDVKNIKDEIVEAVVTRLQMTCNRPHLVKELSSVLMAQLRIVQQSANPCAIISSRLSTFLKRSTWSATSPCPLAKELETVHPRRTYFYLTTCPHPPLSQQPPSSSSIISTTAKQTPSVTSIPALIASRTIITPSLSSGSGSISLDEDEAALSRRRELSPSPEVNLSSADFDDVLLLEGGTCDDDIDRDYPLTMPGTPAGIVYPTRRATLPNATCTDLRRHPRGPSPPLEKDEKEFTQTANGLLQMRNNMRGALTSSSSSSLLSSSAPASVAVGATEAVNSNTNTEHEHDQHNNNTNNMDIDTLDKENALFGENKTSSSSTTTTAHTTATMLAPPAGILSSPPPPLPLPPPSSSSSSSSSLSNIQPFTIPSTLGAIAGFVASPALKPTLSMNNTLGFSKKDHTHMAMDNNSWAQLESFHEWDRSPEKIELEELDCWLDEF